MRTEQRIVTPGVQPQTVRSASGEIHLIPVGWELLPPGDAALTRRVKAAGEIATRMAVAEK